VLSAFFCLQLALLKRERDGLDEELSNNRLDPADARERLLAKVKDDNARILALDKELKSLEEDIAAKKKISADLTADIEERKNDSGEREKYELLFKRDQEMTEFIDRFQETKEKELTEQRKLQNTVSALLEHISEGMEREKSMPTRQQAEEMKEDLSDKNRELKSSQMTAERLQEELTLRQTELNKIATLDVKIGEELKTLQGKMQQMRDDKKRLQDIEGLKRAATQAKEALGVKLREYSRRRDLMRQQVQMLATEVEKRKAQLAKEPQAAALDALENKLKLQEQTVFGLRECEFGGGLGWYRCPNCYNLSFALF
jgi:intraflagellar transport protein 74